MCPERILKVQWQLSIEQSRSDLFSYDSGDFYRSHPRSPSPANSCLLRWPVRLVASAVGEMYFVSVSQALEIGFLLSFLRFGSFSESSVGTLWWLTD